MTPVAAAMFGVAGIYAVMYVAFRASLIDDLKAWIVDREIGWRDFVAEGALCPVCSLWWALLVSHVAFTDWDPLRLVGTYGLFIAARDLTGRFVTPSWGGDVARAAGAMTVAAVAIDPWMLDWWDAFRVAITTGLYAVAHEVATEVFEPEPESDGV